MGACTYSEAVLSHAVKSTTLDAHGKITHLCYAMDVQQFLSSPHQHVSRDSVGADWIFGSLENASALVESLTMGKPTKPIWDAYNSLKSKLDFQETSEAMVSIRRKRVYDECGDEPSVDRWLTGDSRHWSYMRRIGRKPSVTIGIPLAMSCDNAEADFAANVATAVVLVESLLSAGYQVRVLAVWSGHKLLTPTGQRSAIEAGITFPLMEYGEALDEANLLAYGTPGSCRYFCFEHIRQLMGRDGSVDSGLGYARPATPEALALYGVDLMVAKVWEDDTGQASYISDLQAQCARLVGLEAQPA